MRSHRSAGFSGAALAAVAVAVACAQAEESNLARRGGSGGSSASGSSAGGSSGLGGSAAGGSSASGGGGASGKGGATTGGSSGSAGKGGSAGTSGTSGTGGSAGVPEPPTYGCIDDNPGGAGGEGGGAGEGGENAGGAAGEGGAGVGPGLLFFDDFEDGDSDGWLSSNGAFGIVTDGSEVFEQSDNSDNALRVASVAGSCWTDQIVEARVKVTDFRGSSTSYAAALFGRYLDAETHYLVGISNGNSGMLFIGKRIESTSSNPQRIAQKNSLGIEEDVWYTLRLEIAGTTLRAYLDGTLQAETTDSQITSGGVAVGTNHAAARYDEVRVTRP